MGQRQHRVVESRVRRSQHQVDLVWSDLVVQHEHMMREYVRVSEVSH